MTVAAEHGADDELRARVDHLERRRGVEHRAGAEEKARRHLRREAGDELDRARHRHRHLERADAALGDGVDDGLQLRGILDPDDGDDSGGFDRRRGGLAGWWALVR